MCRPASGPAAGAPAQGRRGPAVRALTVRVAVIGAGIVGITTAYELAVQGHAVTVYERRGSVAAEASFADGGVISTGDFALRPPVPRTQLAGPGALPHLPWLWRRWRAGRPPLQTARRRAVHALARLSHERLLELTRSLRLDYGQAPGYLVLLRTERDLQAAAGGLALLREMGVTHDVVGPERCRQLEPGLHAGTALHAGIHLPQDGVGSCRQFAQLLKVQAQRLGVVLRFGTAVTRLTPGTRPQVETEQGQRSDCEAVVVCTGVHANPLLAGIGVVLPLVAVQGFSVTAPLRHLEGQADPAPRAALLDARHQVTISRLGQRVRLAGGAEIGGDPGAIDPASLRALYRVLDDWFPGAALTREAQHWKGARPTLPDGNPVLGDSGAAGIWLNLGHGGSGWTLACGSARVLAECLAGRPPPVDPAGLTAQRLY